MRKLPVVKVFSATKAQDRDRLGEAVTDWLRRNPSLVVTDRIVSQSSDNAFHCLSIVIFGEVSELCAKDKRVASAVETAFRCIDEPDANPEAK